MPTPRNSAHVGTHPTAAQGQRLASRGQTIPTRAKSGVLPPRTGTPIGRIGVAVPVNDEAEALAGCLEALAVAASRVAVPVTIVVVLDACTDGSAAVVQDFSGGRVRAIDVDARSVGVARAAGMSELLRLCGESGTWLATTDGDSVVPPNWFTAQLRHAEAGATVVAGTVAVHDWEDRSAAVRDRARHDYRAVPHRHVHGANLSFSAAAYRAAGGFAPIACHEDVQLVDDFTVNAEPIAWATDLPVGTSARRNSRAPRGFANYLTTLENSLQSSGGRS